MPKVSLRSQHQPQLGLAKSPSMMVTTLQTIDANNLALNNNKNHSTFLRSISVPGPAGSDEENEDENANFEKESVKTKLIAPVIQGSKVVVHRVDDDETFSSFFKSSSLRTPTVVGDVDIGDFDAIKSTEKYVNTSSLE